MMPSYGYHSKPQSRDALLWFETLCDTVCVFTDTKCFVSNLAVMIHDIITDIA